MKYLAIACCVLFAFQLDAQQEGMIMYEEKVDIHRRLPEDRQQYKDMIPQFRTVNFELHFTATESSYRASKVQEEQAGPGSGRGGGMRMRMAGTGDRNVYKNLEENKLVDSREFMTKPFLIKGSLDTYTWKISDGQKEILGYMCLKAVYQDTADTYTAWFTPQMAISNGPADFSGLPGMILQVDVNDGDRTITATEVIAQETDASLLKEPKKGKEVTSEEYREIVREKMEEMRAERGQGGGHVIIRQ